MAWVVGFLSLVCLAAFAALFRVCRRVQEAEEVRLHQTRELARIGREINSSEDLAVILRTLLEAAVRLPQAAAGKVGLLEGEELVFHEGYDRGAWRSYDFHLRRGEGVPGHIMETLKPYVVPDAQRDPYVLPEIRDRLGYRNLVDIPILGRKGELIGCFEVFDKPGGFEEADVELLQGLSVFAAIAIEHERILEERKRAEAQLQDSERRFREIIDFLPDATFVIDKESVVIAWNRAMEDMTGLPAEKMLGLDEHAYAVPFYGERRPMLADLVLHPELAAEFSYNIVERERETLVAEVFLPEYCPGGAHFWVKATPLFDSQGRIVGAIEGIRDITRRKRAEDELKRWNEELEARIGARTAQIAAMNKELQKESEERSRLQQERIEALEQTDKLKDEFLSVISHELRTPLNSIMGFSSLLQDEVMGGLNPPQREYVDKILASADRMLELINNLLDIARMRAGRFELFPVDADYSLLVNEVAAAFGPQAQEKRLTVETEIGVPGFVRIDEQRIAQVLNNLLSNAIKFTPEGGRISIKAFLEGKNLVTEITDTGIGISEEDLPKLFSPFQQLDMSLTRKVGGSGLGLSISKGIVEAHGGRLMAESPGPGQGSTFRFVLPLEQS